MPQNIDAILNAINSGSQYGSYGEGYIATGLNEFRKLQEMFRTGQLSDQEFVQIGDAILPQLRSRINQIAGSGSSGANAAKAAGSEELLKIVRDYDAVKSARTTLGRDISFDDLAKIRPYFEGGNEIGQSYLAQLKEYEARSPEGLKRKSAQYSGDVSGAFQDVLGRAPTAQEIEHYGSYLASGDLDAYALRNAIKQTDEYRTTADRTFREGLNTELQGYDTDAFNKGKEDILSRYTQAGIQNSPALDFALTNLMGDIAKERGKYLAGLSAEHYGGNKELARSDYESTMNKYLEDERYKRDLNRSTMDDYLGRGRELSDYYRQRDDYYDMLSRVPRGRSNNWLDYVNAGANVARGVGSLKSGGFFD